MSILPLERLFDTAATIERRARDEKQDLAGARKLDDDPFWMRCRLCGHEAEAAEYCPHCVAYTMVRIANP